MLIPFAENFRWLRELLPQCTDGASAELTGRILELGARYEARLTPQPEEPAYEPFTTVELPIQDAEHNANIQKACTPAE